MKKTLLLFSFLLAALITYADNKIYYTSSDGEVVTPELTEEFGANIVSNTYTDNKGVITFDGEVTSIGESAFSGCRKLTSITIPNSVTSIGDHAFSDCSKLTSITIPNSVTSIGYKAFLGCSELICVEMGESVTSIEDKAFSGCSNLYSVVISSVESWCNIDFESSSANPLYYAKCLIMDDEVIKNLVIPNSVTSIKDNAFSSCSEFTSVKIPSSVTSIGSSAFSGCSGLKTVRIPSSVTSIGSSAFSGCRGLTSVNISSSVTSIGNSAFYSCDSLMHVTFKTQEVFAIDKYCFSPSVYEIATLYVAEGMASNFASCDGWKNFKNIEEDTSGRDYVDCNGDGFVNGADVVAIYNFIVYGTHPREKQDQ